MGNSFLNLSHCQVPPPRVFSVLLFVIHILSGDSCIRRSDCDQKHLHIEFDNIIIKYT